MTNLAITLKDASGDVPRTAQPCDATDGTVPFGSLPEQLAERVLDSLPGPSGPKVTTPGPDRAVCVVVMTTTAGR